MDDVDLSRTCITLSEFKVQWIVILQHGQQQQQQQQQQLQSQEQQSATSGTTTKVNEESLVTAKAATATRKRRRRIGIMNRSSNNNQFYNSSLTVTDQSHKSNNNHHPDTTGTNCKKMNTTVDLFDCYDTVRIPCTHDMIDTIVDEYIQKWRTLDTRKITEYEHYQQQQQQSSSSLHNDGNNNSNSEDCNNKALPKWYEKHIRLPDDFDYTTILRPPPIDNNDSSTGDRVINFLDPSKSLSYHTELWNLFHSIPFKQQIDEDACMNHALTNTEQWFDQYGTVIQGTKLFTTTEWDYHGISRFRMNDRHALPPLLPLEQQQQQQQSHHNNNSTTDCINNRNNVNSNQTNLEHMYCGLIRLECLRKQLRRTSTPDPNRMVLEFLGSQTLLQVHNTIVEITDDELWYHYSNTVPACTILSSPKENDDDDTSDADDDEDHSKEQENDSCDSVNHSLNDESAKVMEMPSAPDQNAPSSGYFFIENTFYVVGTEDYTTPITKWLQKGTEREQKRRMEYLGIGPDLPKIELMQNMKLYDLPTRFGVRYVHVHNGDIECSIFVTDRRIMLQHDVQQIHHGFPIIHDIWTPSYSVPECDVCHNRVAVIATSTKCVATLGHKALCEECARQLRLQETSRNHIERYTIWRGQADLSAGASKEIAW